MPFGFTNVPSTFQAMMNLVFDRHLCKFIIVFFDDILVFSRLVEDHVQHLSKVMALMTKHKLVAKNT